MGRLKNRVALISGGTSGIGAASARLFAQEGASVVICGRNKENGRSLAQEINDSGCIAKYVCCDVTDEMDVQNLIRETVETFGAIDVLFNNAGTFLPSVELDRLEYDAWKQTFSVNVDGYFLLTKYARPHLINSRGVILNNASIAGMHSYLAGRSYAYSASKAAVIQFSRMMAKNYAEDKIRVNCICPGIILTPILHGRDPKVYEDRIPLGRVGSPEDVARAALFLVSDESAYITGVVLPVDGGGEL